MGHAAAAILGGILQRGTARWQCAGGTPRRCAHKAHRERARRYAHKTQCSLAAAQGCGAAECTHASRNAGRIHSKLQQGDPALPGAAALETVRTAHGLTLLGGCCPALLTGRRPRTVARPRRRTVKRERVGRERSASGPAYTTLPTLCRTPWALIARTFAHFHRISSLFPGAIAPLPGSPPPHSLGAGSVLRASRAARGVLQRRSSRGFSARAASGRAWHSLGPAGTLAQGEQLRGWHLLAACERHRARVDGEEGVGEDARECGVRHSGRKCGR
jgi:hypothetical protein